ncbi:MAG: hypothetical protein JNL67_13355 [Planctomycetaceae bacterium]|nr:hypothetical protein [Planctomycetaceae bacterium]
MENHPAREAVAGAISELRSISLMDVEMLGIWPPERTKKMYEDVHWELQLSLRKLHPEYFRLLELDATAQYIRYHAVLTGKYEDLVLYKHPEFRESLKITNVQAERLAVTEKKIEGKLAETMAATEKRIKHLLKEHYAKLRENLGTEQLDWWDEMVGEPIALDDKTRLLDVSGKLSSRNLYSYNDDDRDFREKIHKVFYDEDMALKPSEIALNESICNSFLGALIRFPNEIDDTKIAEIKRRILQNTDLGFREFNDGSERERMLDDPDFRYPAAIVEILSPTELKRVKQLEFQHLVGGEFTSFGLSWAHYNRRLSNDDWARVTEAVGQVKQKIDQELRDFAVKVREILQEAYVACERDLTAAQIQALGLITSEYDIAGWISGATKTENVEDTVRKLNSRNKL